MYVISFLASLPYCVFCGCYVVFFYFAMITLLVWTNEDVGVGTPLVDEEPVV